jgi:hypothetical protein
MTCACRGAGGEGACGCSRASVTAPPSAGWCSGRPDTQPGHRKPTYWPWTEPGYYIPTVFYPHHQRPHRCPVCEGRGAVPAGFYTGASPSTNPETCKSCLGAGVLWR